MRFKKDFFTILSIKDILFQILFFKKNFINFMNRKDFSQMV